MRMPPRTSATTLSCRRSRRRFFLGTRCVEGRLASLLGGWRHGTAVGVRGSPDTIGQHPAGDAYALGSGQRTLSILADGALVCLTSRLDHPENSFHLKGAGGMRLVSSDPQCKPSLPCLRNLHRGPSFEGAGAKLGCCVEDCPAKGRTARCVAVLWS